MDEDTRKLILRIQSEDLAALWNLPTENSSEIDATLRVYRRQLSLLDRHLEDTRQARIAEGADGSAHHDAVTSALQTTDTHTSTLTGDSDVHSREETSSLVTSTAPTPSVIKGLTAHSLFQASDRPFVRHPSFAPTAGEQADKLMRIQLRTAAKQQVKAHERAVADNYSNKPKPINTTLPAAVVRNPTLESTEPSVNATTNLKRSADHFAAPGAPPFKKQIGIIIKKEQDAMPELSAQKDTIRDTLENLLQSSRPLASPTVSTKKTKRGKRAGYERIRGLGPGTKPPILGPRPMALNHMSTASMSVAPGMPSDMIKPNIGYYGQRFGSLQLGSFPRPLHQTPPDTPAFDIKAFDAATPVQRKQIFGEALYYKIQRLQPQLAGKITGMLLEMDNATLYHLITDDAALRNKTEEAMRVYNDYREANPAEDV